MKTAETKSASHQPNNTAAKSFFNQGQEQTFFSENSSDRTSFFPSTASDQVQFKPIAGGRSFFSPASVALQAKCAACEAEEQAAAKESMAEPPTLQRTPAFESEGAIQAKVAPKTDAIALPTPSQTPPNSDTKELEQPEEAIAGTPEIQMMPAFSSAEDTGDGEDGNAEQPPVQFSLKVGQPGDAYEREADAMADRVVSMPRVMSSDVTPKTIGAPQPQQVNRKQTMGMRSLMRQPADGSPAPAPKNLESRLQSQGSGAPLDTNTLSEMEGAFDADFSGVQVHTGQEAATLNQSLGARAFTHGNKIFFNSGEYQPQSQSGKHLLAHELTHTLQQGASVQRKPAVSPTSNEVQMLPSIISSELAKYARNIPGYTLLTVVIGFNPLTGNRVIRNAINLLEGLMGLVPFGIFIFDKLREHGILQSAFKWVEGELTRLDLSLARIERTIEEAWEDVRLIEGFDYNLEVLKRHFGKLYNDVKSFALSLVNHVIELIKKAVISQVEKLLADNKAWALIKKILHYDPLKGEAVEATIEEILEDFLRLIGKEQELEQMREKGTLKETAAWIKTQIGTFLSLLGELKGLFTAAWDAIQPQNLPNLATNLRNLVTQASGFLKRVWTFAVTVATKVLELIKKVLLGWLSQHAAKTPGYFLLTVILGKDIFTQQVVTRSVTNIIKGFITLLPNGEQQYKQMEETGVIARAAGRIEALMSQLGITWAFVRDLFLGIWNKLTIESLIQPIATFIQIVSLFKEPILRLLKFTIEVIKIVLDLVLQLMNFPPGIVGRIINNAMQAFEDIKKNPVGFLLNLLKAVKTGFLKFFDNILKHLLSGVKDWLFSQLGKAGIEVPKDFTLESVLKLVFKVLDITMEKMWKKLADRIGQPAVDKIRGAIDKLVGIWNFVKDVQQRGMAAIWEYIQGQISNLWDTVLGFVRDWIMKKIVDKVVTKLLSMLDPTGIMAVVNSFIAFFNAVQSAIEYFRQILEIVDSFVGTVAEIATGNVDRAAQFLENLLARSLPVAIGFLANQVGLGNVGEKIQEIIAGVRLMVDKALDWLVDQAVKLGKAALNALGLGGGDDKKKDIPHRDPIVKNFSLLGEKHSLRLGQTDDGDVKITMASEDWGNFPLVLKQLKERQVTRLKSEKREEEATKLEAELQTLIDEATAAGGAGGPVQQAKYKYQKEMNAVPKNQQDDWRREHGDIRDAMMEAWEKYYNDFEKRLEALDKEYDFSGGKKDLVKTGDVFADRVNNKLMKASNTNIRKGSFYGVEAFPANSNSSPQDIFYSYESYSASGTSGWGPLGSIPPLLPYSPITPATSSWRSRIHHVIINDKARSAGSPSNSSQSVPGIDPKYYNRGHLIANSLGGPGDYLTGNIVPMTSSANQGQMASKLENPVRGIFAADPFKNDPQNNIIVDIKAQPNSWNAKGEIPMQVNVEYQQIYPVTKPKVTDTVSNT